MEGITETERPAVRPYIISVEGTEIIIVRCAESAKQIRQIMNGDTSHRYRCVQTDVAMSLHMHHDNGDCIPFIGTHKYRGSFHIMEVYSSAVHSGAVIEIV